VNTADAVLIVAVLGIWWELLIWHREWRRRK